MPGVRRKVESVHDEHGYSALFVALGREQDLRRHDFAVPAETEEWISLRTDVSRGVLRVRVLNDVPHALPTGAFGRRKVRVVTRWPGGSDERDLAGTMESSIAAGGEREVRIPLPAHVHVEDVEVRLERWDRTIHDWTGLSRALR